MNTQPTHSVITFLMIHLCISFSCELHFRSVTFILAPPLPPPLPPLEATPPPLDTAAAKFVVEVAFPTPPVAVALWLPLAVLEAGGAEGIDEEVVDGGAREDVMLVAAEAAVVAALA
jgi:hypothetical protein